MNFEERGPLISFTWTTHLIESGPNRGRFIVRETATSLGEHVDYGPFPGHLIESFIRARRAFVSRKVREANGVKIFTH